MMSKILTRRRVVVVIRCTVVVGLCAFLTVYSSDSNDHLDARRLLGYNDDGKIDDETDSENNIIFVVIIASVLICGCACMSGVCESDGSRSGTPLNEPLMSRDEMRNDIFANSLVGAENEWLCPVCAFENRPRNAICSLCGSSQDTARKYYDAMRKRQEEALDSGQSDPLGTFRASLVEPSLAAWNARSSGLSRAALSGFRDSLTQGEREQAFAARRFNSLTMRQRAAHRRRLWQRRSDDTTGKVEWVRMAVGKPETAAHSSAPEHGAPSSYPLHPNRDSFGDSAPMSRSPGFASILDPLVPGKMSWEAVRGVATDAFHPIKKRILVAGDYHEATEGDEEAQNSEGPKSAPGRSSMPTAEVETEKDLIGIAALPFRRKQQWLQSCLDALRSPELALAPSQGGGVVKLQVRRDRVLADSFAQLMTLEPHLMARRLRILFVDEPGVDAGGPLREWFGLVSEQLFDPNFALFVSQGDSGYSINPMSSIANSLHLKYFRFVGRFIGKALLEHQTLSSCRLSLPMLKHVLGVPLAFSDLEFDDGELWQHLVYLRDAPPGIASELCLDFTVDIEHMGARITHELVPGGAQIPVTDENKLEYLERRFKFRVMDSVKDQLWQILCGLYEVVPREALSVFDYQELDLLLSGVPEVDLDDWKRHTRYVGLYKKLGPRHPVVKWFWEVAQDFNQEERARLLQFTTGNARLPAQGFKALEANGTPRVCYTVLC